MAPADEIVVATLYKFVRLTDYQRLQPRLLDFCRRQGLKGTLLLAEEGINGTVAGPRRAVDAVMDYLRADRRLSDLAPRESRTGQPPFRRMKVRLKKEIVTLGEPAVDPNQAVGRYVEPRQWNALIGDPEVLLIDTRNRYEYDIGTFEGAVNPDTDSFREFPRYVKQKLDPTRHKKVAMFCTGGIRCEKATSYLIGQGFEQVYHLKGGILNYLETVPEHDSRWRGECFVFDERVAVTHGLKEGSYDQCHACRHPVSAEDKASPRYRPGVCCPHCEGRRSPAQVAAAAERYKQVQLAKKRRQRHLGQTIERDSRPKRQKIVDT